MSRKINDYLLIKHTPNGREYPYLDCWGLIVDVYREILDIKLHDYTDLTQKDMNKGLMYERDSGRFVEVKEPQDYDIVAFFVNGRLYHVGLWIGGRILHTSQQRNCRYEQLDRVSLSQKRYYRYVKDRGSK
ncbi:MAG: C40 family peptidase [Bacteroidales bacterium]|nr:C40 family peptidase [Bacteroidales bacterium]